jgi:hypothetical protein
MKSGSLAKIGGSACDWNCLSHRPTSRITSRNISTTIE